MATTFRPVGVENLGISYSASTLSVTGTGGRSLSSSNPGIVTLPSKTTGSIVSVPVTANQGFIDDTGASEIIGNTFGLTSGVAYAVDMPFYIYAVLNDAETAIAFMIARMPHSRYSPASGSIGMPSSAVATADTDFWSIDNVTATNYDGNPCICIGSFRMTMSALDDWTVSALSNEYDGIGNFQEATQFSISPGHFGAASGKYFKDNAGTAPGFSSNTTSYTISQDGFMNYTGLHDTNNVAGVGAVNCQYAIPFTAANQYIRGSGDFYDNGTTQYSVICPVSFASTTTVQIFVPYIRTGGYIQNGDIAASDQIHFSIRYRMSKAV